LFFNLRSSKQRLGWLSNEEAKSMADELGVTTAEVYEMEKRLSANDVTFDLSSDQDDDEGAFAPSQYLAAESADPAETLEAEEWDTYTRDRFQSALNGLDARSKDILAQRWLAEEKATLQDLADKYKVSAERIRQLENAAVNKLKAAVLEAA
jgi:RNA polymerase sigma-32 factor